MNSRKNYLEYVFCVKNGLSRTDQSPGEVIIHMENKGAANRIAQLLFKKPKISHITLVGMGSFIFRCIDGKRSVFEIGVLVHDKFGDEAEPLYERLCVYMKQLERFGFIARV